MDSIVDQMMSVAEMLGWETNELRPVTNTMVMMMMAMMMMMIAMMMMMMVVVLLLMGLCCCPLFPFLFSWTVLLYFYPISS